MTPLPTIPFVCPGLGFVAWAGRDAQLEAERATERPLASSASGAVTLSGWPKELR